MFCIAMLCSLAIPATFAHAQATQAIPGDTYNHLMTMMEKDVVGAAEAMPADKYNFAPTQGEFKGVRTFALQVRHIATVINQLASGVTGEKMPAEVGIDE